jgi:hypothetical protein
MSEPEKWELSINQNEWHLALDPQGLYFRLRPDQAIPDGIFRIYPGKLHAWQWFNQDGSLRLKYRDLPVYGG